MMISMILLRIRGKKRSRRRLKDARQWVISHLILYLSFLIVNSSVSLPFKLMSTVDFLYNRSKPYDGILQKFLDP